MKYQEAIIATLSNAACLCWMLSPLKQLNEKLSVLSNIAIILIVLVVIVVIILHKKGQLDIMSIINDTYDTLTFFLVLLVGVIVNYACGNNKAAIFWGCFAALLLIAPFLQIKHTKKS